MTTTTAAVVMPECVSGYDKGDETCDAPCGWRDLCGGFKAYLGGRGEEASKYIREADAAGTAVAREGDGKALLKLMRDCVKLYDVKDGVARNPPPVPTPLPAGGTNGGGAGEGSGGGGGGSRKGRGAYKAAQTKRDDLVTLFNHLKAQLEENLPHRFAPPQEAPTVGQMYVRDRTNASGRYLSVYVKTSEPYDQPILLARLRPRTMTFDVELPLEPEALNAHWGKAGERRYKPRAIDDGRFRSLVKRVDRQRFSLLAEYLGQMVKQGSLRLSGGSPTIAG